MPVTNFGWALEALKNGGVVSLKYGRKCIGIELNPEYNVIAEKRIRQAIAEQGLFRQEQKAEV